MYRLFDIPAKSLDKAAPKGDGITRDARFTKSGERRFMLTRSWRGGDGRYVLFCMLNPSTANASTDDPTIRRCIRYARDWGHSALHVVNLFDFITPSPEVLLRWTKENPMKNLQLYLDIIQCESFNSGLTVCGWGTWGGWFPERARQVYNALNSPHALRITKDGHPSHPLYLPANLKPVPFTLANL